MKNGNRERSQKQAPPLICICSFECLSECTYPHLWLTLQECDVLHSQGQKMHLVRECCIHSEYCDPAALAGLQKSSTASAVPSAKKWRAPKDWLNEGCSGTQFLEMLKTLKIKPQIRKEKRA